MVPFPPTTVDVLRRLRAAQLEARVKAGEQWTDHGLVFSSRSGELLEWKDMYHRHFVPTAKRAGIALRPYDLRHIHASLLLAQGIPLRAISERLGHFDPGFTLATYTHTVPGTQEAAAAATDEALFGTR